MLFENTAGKSLPKATRAAPKGIGMECERDGRRLRESERGGERERKRDRHWEKVIELDMVGESKRLYGPLVFGSECPPLSMTESTTT